MPRAAIALMLGLSFWSAAPLRAQQAPLQTWAQLEGRLAQGKDTLWVVNFWATWCRPCVAELPAFEKLNAELAPQKVKVLLVSNDFLDQVNSHLLPFMKKRNIRSEVVVMNETNPNNWVGRLHPDWGGALPATLIIDRKGQRVAFKSEALGYEQLLALIKPYI